MGKYTPQRIARIHQSLHPSPFKLQAEAQSQSKKGKSKQRHRRNPRAKSRSGRFWLTVDKQKHSLLHSFRKQRNGIVEFISSFLFSAASLFIAPKENEPVPTRVFIRQIGKLYKRIDRLEAQLVKEKAEREKWFEKMPKCNKGVDQGLNVGLTAPVQASSLKKRNIDTVTSGPAAVVSSDPRLLKYSKMLKMGVPKPAVMQKMARDGLDPSELFGGAPSGIVAQKPKGIPRTTLADLKKVKLQKSTRNLGEKRKAPTTSNPRVITLDQLRSVKLRKTTSEDVRSPKTPARQTNMPGAVVSLAQLQSVKLKRTPKRDDPGKENASVNSTGASKLREVVTFKLRKTEGIQRSPGGTPTKEKAIERSPSAARTDAEFLHLALRRKFANSALSFAQENTPGQNTSPSYWS